MTAKIHFKKMTTNDYPLMLRWLNTKEIAQFYGNNEALTLQFVREKYGTRISGIDPVVPLIVFIDLQPVGYIQYYELDQEAKDCQHVAKSKKIIGLDMFIGEVPYLNKGYGTEILRTFIEITKYKHKIAAIIVDPSIENQRAIRCYTKCGFVKQKNIQNNYLLMMYVF